MQSFIISVNAIMPIVIMAFIGYFIQHKNLLSPQTFSQMNKLCFKLFLPCLLFYNIYTADSEAGENLRLIAFGLAGVLVLFLALTVTVPFFVKVPTRQSVVIQGIFRANYILLGVPVAQVICGEGNIEGVALMAGFVIPLVNFLAVITLSTHSGKKASYGQVLLNILKNPLILASLAAFVMRIIGVPLPTFVSSTLRDLGRVATPLALITLGGSLSLETTIHNRKALFGVCFMRLLVAPAIFVPIAYYLMHFTGPNLVAVLMIFAAPTAVSSYVMTQQMGGDSELAGEIVLATSVASCFTMFIWIFSLSYIGLI